MKTNIPYTYLIGWPEHNKWYYGVRYAKKCSPDDFWNPYKTSSKIVKKFVAGHGDPPVRIIRKIFSQENNAVKLAQDWENRVLKKLKVVKDEKWLNGHDSKCFDTSLVPKGDKHWTRQIKNSEKVKQWKEKFRRISPHCGPQCRGTFKMPAGAQHWTKKNTDAARRHATRMLSKDNPNNLPDVKKIKSARLKINNPVNLPGIREKISKTLTGKKRPRKICEYCNKDVADSIYTRSHGKKCKHKNNPS